MAYLAAVVQLTTTTDVSASMAQAEALVAEAAGRGAQLVALPENVAFMGPEADKRALAQPVDGPLFRRLGELAGRHGIHLVAGTLPERGPDPEHVYNTSVLYGPDGQARAVYRKIHLFDVALGEGATHTESASVAPGAGAVRAETPLGTFGLSVCYDLRFPDLYRTLVRAGAELLFVPAAFTVPTGRDHWEVLLRARAIESQAYVLAPAQVGNNAPGRVTYGRSVIIDPWGTVLAQAPDRPGVIYAEIDLGRVHDFRRKLPCLDHERPTAYRVLP
ncbi:MAG: carbon-nitrogen hydrolase family protein [Myxococcales bacterium]|nr:carbon-nitrogen hydrolase family protein [Myxococcales bacterium]MCB9645787.1 carbon-nitrogen hydrolase family protein [Deltaproteobacteria bacterium]